MPTLDENERMEYTALVSQAHRAERTSLICWTVAALAATGFLAWGIASGHPGLMVAPVLAAAAGFMAAVRAREQALLVAGYVAEFFESRDASPAWFTRLTRLRSTSGGAADRDRHATLLLNGICAAAAAFAWLRAERPANGEMLAGIVTGCAMAFAFYSFGETTRLRQTDPAGQWRQTDGGLKEIRRTPRASAR